jgi:thioredoxin 1
LARQNFAPSPELLNNIGRTYVAAGCHRKQGLARQLIYQQQNDDTMNTQQAKEINETEFETEVLRSPQPVLVGFLTGWSKPCRLVEPILDEVAQACDGNAKIFKVNVDDNPDLGTVYAIQSVPTLIYFFNGTIRGKIIGMASPKAILTKLKLLTPENPPANKSGRLQ